MLNQDYKEMLQCLLGEKVEFLLVGAYALAVHGYPRATKDIDIWVWANPANAAKVLHALKKFGAPVGQLSESDFHQEGVVYQIGTSPRRVDIVTQIDGVAFPEAYDRRVTVSIDGLNVPVIGKEDLIANKQASGRPQDLVDAARLQDESAGS